jgi:hypothetical protein
MHGKGLDCITAPPEEGRKNKLRTDVLIQQVIRLGNEILFRKNSAE